MSGYWEQYPELQKDLEEVQNILSDSARSGNAVIDEALEGIVAAKGKMLRPAFLILSSRFGTPAREKTLKMAAAVEFLHMATLVHDDIIDNAGTRRGRPAVHATYGRRRAILMGDYLFAKSFSLIAEYAAPGNAQKLSNAVMQICTSEIAQSSGTFRIKRSIREYLQRIAGKTAVLFAMSCYSGASESGATEELSTTLRRIGYNIGMGFQIIDDILDYESSESVIGKPAGNDLRQGIYTLPLILALRESARGGSAGELTTLLEKRPYADGTIAEIMRLVGERGGIERARRYAAKYTERAFREIGKLPEGQARRELYSLTERLLVREY